jgi:diaminopimelate epimerase
VETLAGTMTAEVMTNENNQVTSVRIDMGAPELTCRKIPFDSPQKMSDGKAVEVPLDVGGKSYTITAVSMGNPHAVIFVDDVDAVDLKSVGPAIENHARFPEKTNVEFVQVLGPGELKMKVWERGAGITLACGTGACAALVAASLTNRAKDRAVIHLDGGDLEIFWDKQSNHLFMQGPAVPVFSGRIRLD